MTGVLRGSVTLVLLRQILQSAQRFDAAGLAHGVVELSEAEPIGRVELLRSEGVVLPSRNREVRGHSLHGVDEGLVVQVLARTLGHRGEQSELPTRSEDSGGPVGLAL